MSAGGSAQGLATVVFVDVEGSTELLRRVGDQAGVESVRSQLDLVRERVEPYGGFEAKSLGDGLLLTFSSPRQAVSFALASQRALAGTTPRVRFGINTGEVIGADVDPLGGAVNAASRIADRAAGGEVIVSDVVRQLVGTAPAIRFVDRGRCRLKGFAERWHLWAAEDHAGVGHPPATIGRSAELELIAELVSSTATGIGQVLLLEGEAGIGKTHLLREACAQSRRAGVQVVEVAADELVRRPGAVSHGLLEAARPGLAARARVEELLNSPTGVSETGREVSFGIVEASIDLIEVVARTHPVLLAAEDLHWADDLSLAVLAALVRRASASRFSVVATLRPSPRPPALDRLLELGRNGLGRHVRLDGLDELDVNAMASALTGAAPGPVLRERLRSTSGNPLFVSELLRCLDDDRLLQLDGGVADVGPGVVSQNLNETLVRRLSWLPEETNELLRLASLFGGSFTLHDLAAITGRSVVDAAAWLREASAAGVVIGDADRLAFRHELIRDAVYAQMYPAVRRDLHRAAGQALARAGAPVQQIAQQFARGARPGDVEAVAWLDRAARETLPISPSSAIAVFEEAVALAPAQWPGRAAVQARMVLPLAWCGRFDEAEALAHAILATSPGGDVEFAALLGLSAVHGNRGDIAAAITAVHQAAGAAGAPADEALRLRCLAAQLGVLTGSTDVGAARQIADETLASGVADGDATTQCLAHQTLSVIATVTGYSGSARDHASAALALFDTGPVTPSSYLTPDTFFALALICLDAIDDAVVAADGARRRAEQSGALALLPMAYGTVAGAHFLAGRWDDATAETEAGRAVVDDTGNLNFILYYEAVDARIAVHRGDLATAQAHLDAGGRRLAAGGSLFGADWLLFAQAELLAATGDLDAAVTVAESTWAQTAPIRYFYGYRDHGTFLVRTAVAAGRDDLARAVTAELEEGARRSPATSVAAAALQCRGLVDRDPDALLEAVARYRETPLRPELAACCEDAARVLTASGRRDEAVPLLQEAATILAEVGATADASRIDAALRAVGVRRKPRKARPSFGWDALTAMELAVSSLVAEGLTNPEIGARMHISRRTVETHLSHVFTKLGLTSRTQLAAEIARQPVDASSDPGATGRRPR